MARSDQNNRWVGIIIGPAIVIVCMAVLWKNEGSFDYHRAAKNTDEIKSLTAASDGQLISYTGPMDQGLIFEGEYVESLVGYLTVHRDAEIKAWHKSEDDDGTDWSLRWMSVVEGNSRNSNVRQTLRSHRYLPPQFDVGELDVDADQIEFVDWHRKIDVNTLALTDKASKLHIEVRGEYLYLEKNKPEDLGDERVSFRGIPVPETATYFGKFQQNRGVAHQAEQKDRFLDALIQDTGVLHHLVIGERSEALGTMKGHIARLKWIVRGAGTLGTVIGFFILFSTFTAFLYQIPLLGDMVQWGVLAISVVLGLVLSLITIAISYLVHHPFVLIGLIIAAALIFFLLRRRTQQTQQSVKHLLDEEFGHELSVQEIKELEFLELARVAMSDRQFDPSEKKYLVQWARKHGWGETKFNEMIARARDSPGFPAETTQSEQHLKNLIRLALADGSLRTYELRSIQLAARDLGYSQAKIQELMRKVRDAAIARQRQV